MKLPQFNAEASLRTGAGVYRKTSYERSGATEVVATLKPRPTSIIQAYASRALERAPARVCSVGAATRTAAGFATTGLTYLPTVCGMTPTASITDGDGKEQSATGSSQTRERQSWNSCLQGPRCAVNGPAVEPRLSR